MSARFPDMFALAASLMLLAACAASDAPGQVGANAEERSSHRQETVLLDPARQLYRYGSGTCRELGKLPAPWRELVHLRYEKPGPWGRFPPGYSSVTKYPSSTTEVRLEAEYAQLGVPPANTLPGTIRRSGLLQDVAVLSLGRPLDEHAHWIHQKILGALSATPPDWRPQQPLPFKKRWGEERVYLPMEAPFPASAQYGVYAEGSDYVSDKSSLMIINPAQRAGVYCDPDYNLPNPTCMGLILLGDDEVATIDVNYEALGTLQDVVASMIDAARAIRVDCPVEAPAP